MKHSFIWWSWAAPGFVGAILGQAIWSLEHGRLPPSGAFLIMIVFSVAFAGVLFLLFKLVPFLSTSPSGIRGLNTWCWPREIPWPEISHVAPITLWPFPYVRVFSDKHRSALWVPLFVSKPDLLMRVVQENTDPHNPLRQFLEARAA